MSKSQIFSEYPVENNNESIDHQADYNYNMLKNIYPFLLKENEGIKYALTGNLDAFLRQSVEETPFDVDFARFLLKKGANIDSLTDDQRNKYQAVLLQINYDSLKTICFYENNRYIEFTSIVNADSFLKKHMVESSYRRDMRFAKFLLKHGAKLDSLSNDHRTKLFHQLMYERYSECRDKFSKPFPEDQDFSLEQECLDKGVQVDDFNRQGYTALQGALIYKRDHLVKFLLEKGADINISDKKGYTIADHACVTAYDNKEQRHVHVKYSIKPSTMPNPYVFETKEAFIEYLNKTSKNLRYLKFLPHTSLYQALIQNNIEEASRILSSEKVNIDLKDQFGLTVFNRFLLAYETDSKSQIDFLMDKTNANIHTISDNGSNLLHHACRQGKIYAVRRLVEKGVDCELKNQHDKTPIDEAKDKKHTEIVEFLQKHIDEKNKVYQESSNGRKEQEKKHNDEVRISINQEDSISQISHAERVRDSQKESNYCSIC